MNSSPEELTEMVDRLARFFFLAKRYGTRLHAEADISTGERAVLFEIEQEGPRTVPQMADRRGISRQAIQKTVDSLVARGLTDKRVAKGDLRSRTIHLTRQGKIFVRQLKKRERQDALSIKADIPIEELRKTAQFMDWLEMNLARRIAELDHEGDVDD